MSLKLLFFASIVALCAGLAPALAASGRTFVSGKGADSGACAITAPCRSFSYALTQTAVSGEVVVLDSAGYGSLSITRAVSISNPSGVEAGISVPSGGTGITINAPGARVDLRGLLVDGQGVGGTGIDIKAAQHVNIIDIVARNLTTAGINVEAGQALIHNALISNASTGLLLQTKTCCSTIEGSTIVDNAQYGVRDTEFVATVNTVTSDEIKHTTVSGNATGISVAASNILLSDVDSFGNSIFDVDNSGATVLVNSRIGTFNNQDIVITLGNNEVAQVSGSSFQSRAQQ